MTLEEYNHSVTLYADRLFRFVAKNVKDRHLAEDIVQESYEKMWKNVAELSADKARAWLFTTAYRAMIDRLRREKRMVASAELPAGIETTTHTWSDVRERLSEGVARLPEIQRIVLTLRDYEGYSYQEIGEMTTLSESQVKVYIYRARVFLKNYIGKLEVLV
ncbi:MAG: RNA polymerase sigma factor [Prolixibacteraceae bacterium]|jgi:RNA polymerase sigma-70 factor (ECF subfamily)|nr:RNA polymerase sigma factor [Prolixibacteraceae bacterium]NLX28576.1 RNA polymerase sigma factor [Bacteroidales bacterium]HNQ37072.1 RNA polymerase sigma factor [Prolixibacteraceae bacterium]HPJ77944.1 RNA polymerase sigma factor [Prolixibacteraceae bacterium]HRV87981.1 RNA polymerase sigma factor [Prolixibacteraceae bacterium]